jgi:N-acetylmuramoyl-L-alanine amidase
VQQSYWARRGGKHVLYLGAVGLAHLLASMLAIAAPAPAAASQTIGHSVEGRPIQAVRVGSASAAVKVLVFGLVHGDEPGGSEVVARLRHSHPPRGVALYLVPDLNPDGTHAGRRQNAHGVDLNRNFPYRWQAAPRGENYPGPSALSEPESQAAAALIRRIKPRVTVWYHQALRIVVKGQAGGDPALERLYSRRSGLARRGLSNYHGTAISWQNHTFRGDSAFVVELPGGRLGTKLAGRNAAALMAVARAVSPPQAVSKPIPFPQKRKDEMRAYAKRHYGIDDYRLAHPHVIVEHYTATNSFGSAFNTFAQDTPDVEFHELPGVCSHYVIDRDGTIYKLVSLKLMCRHTVGLNYTAIGIEHVGQSDAQVLGDKRQLRASLRLTRMLQGRYGIATRNVIGHNESLSSPYHRERVARLRNRTHGDFRRSSMNRYRRALGGLPAPRSVRARYTP